MLDLDTGGSTSKEDAGFEVDPGAGGFWRGSRVRRLAARTLRPYGPLLCNALSLEHGEAAGERVTVNLFGP